MSRHASKNLVALAFAASALIAAGAASAAQGPGIADGTASTTTQLGMAIMVYGLSAVVVTAGLIGAVRQR